MGKKKMTEEVVVGKEKVMVVGCSCWEEMMGTKEVREVIVGKEKVVAVGC